MESFINENGVVLLRLRQTFIALGPLLITVSLGLTEGYSAVLLPQLEANDAWTIDTELSSWIASIAILPMPIGCLLGGWLMEVIGRKMVHLITCIPNIIGWLLIGLSGQSVTLLLAGRFITGMCVGILGPVLAVYIAETSDPIYRGFLLPAATLALNLGITIAHITGSYLEWKMVAFLACIYPVSSFVLLLFASESPTYLIKRGNIGRAKNDFFWLRGKSEQSIIELNLLISKQQYETSLPKKTVADSVKIFIKPIFYRPMIILMVFFTTMQLSGNNPIAFYTVDIMKEVLGESNIVGPYESMIFMDVVRLIGSLLGCFGQQYIKRRTLMIISCSGTLISLLTLSIYLFSVKIIFLNYNIAYIAVIALTTAIFFMNIGLLPLPYSMSGELFSQPQRGLGNAIVTLFNMILFFVIVKITPWLFERLHSEGVFCLFAICCLTGMVVLIIILPETKNKPLHEIENYFISSAKQASRNTELNNCYK